VPVCVRDERDAAAGDSGELYEGVPDDDPGPGGQVQPPPAAPPHPPRHDEALYHQEGTYIHTFMSITIWEHLP